MQHRLQCTASPARYLKRRFIPAVTAAVFVVVAMPATVSAADGKDSPDTVRRQLAANAEVLANEILNRWEPVALSAGMHTPTWRELFATQLLRMDVPVLSEIARVKSDLRGSAKADYAEFLSAFKSAVMQQYMTGQNGKGTLKLGSATTDQVFIAIAPCRIVDTRNLLGPIAAGLARNYHFYAASAAIDWGTSQGGTAGTAGTVCPGTVNPNGGAPSAAVVTVTVVSPSAAGNFIMWGGASPTPTVSVLNWNNPGDIAANTTVVPGGGRTGAGPGGAVQDFAVAYNGPSGQAQVVVDVVGYFVENLATPLDCFNTARLQTAIAANQIGFVNLPACPTGYTRTSMTCVLEGRGTVNAIGEDLNQCWGQAPATVADTLDAGSRCCRIPGR